MADCFAEFPSPVVYITPATPEKAEEPKSAMAEVDLFTVYSNLLNLAKNLGCVNKVDSLPENKVICTLNWGKMILPTAPALYSSIPCF